MKGISLSAIISFVICLSACHSSTQPEEANTNNSGTISTEKYPDWSLLPFVKTDSVNPILAPGDNTFLDPITHEVTGWEAKNVFNPAVIVRNDTLFMLYRAQDSIGKPTGTSRIGLAASVDGVHFARYPSPVLYPMNDAYKK